MAAIQSFVIMFAALLGATVTAIWIAVVIWAFRDTRAHTRDVFAQILGTLLVLVFLPFFPFAGLDNAGFHKQILINGHGQGARDE